MWVCGLHSGPTEASLPGPQWSPGVLKRVVRVPVCHQEGSLRVPAPGPPTPVARTLYLTSRAWGLDEPMPRPCSPNADPPAACAVATP